MKPRPERQQQAGFASAPASCGSQPNPDLLFGCLLLRGACRCQKTPKHSVSLQATCTAKRGFRFSEFFTTLYRLFHAALRGFHGLPPPPPPPGLLL